MNGRRCFLQTIGASAALGWAGPLKAAAADEDASLEALLRRHAELFLHRSPEEATNAAYDIGANSALRGRLDDRSLLARARDVTAVKTARAELGLIQRPALSPRARLDYDVAAYVYDTLSDLLGRYGYVDLNLRPSPYVVSQMNGAYYWLPDFIGTRHPLATPGDAEAWLSRLAAFSVALDQETDRIRHDANIGVVPPSFVIDRTIPQIKALRDGPLETSALVGAAVKRAREKGLGDFGPRAEAIFRSQIQPALTRQAAALERLRPGAVETAGVWRLPDGDAY